MPVPTSAVQRYGLLIGVNHLEDMSGVGYALSVQEPLPHNTPLCPVHPGVPARGVCARCGSFVCDACTENGQHETCLACRARVGAPFRFTRDAFTTSGLASHAFATFKRDWVTLVVGLVIVGTVIMLLGGLQGVVQLAVLGVKGSQIPFATNTVLLSSALGLVLNLCAAPMLVGYIQLCLAALRGAPASVGTLFAPYARFGTIATLVACSSALGLACNLVVSVFYGDQTALQFYASAWIWGLLAAPVFVYVGLGLSFVYAVLADDPAVGPFEAVARSWRLADGKRGVIFWISFVCLAAMMLGFVMCLLPSVVVTPWTALLWSGAYLALSTPTSPRA